ncbi:hypothetical protein ACLK1S_25345 [Escherichia coli]
MIQNPELSLAGGAIRGGIAANFYYFEDAKSLADHVSRRRSAVGSQRERA